MKNIIKTALFGACMVVSPMMADKIDTMLNNIKANIETIEAAKRDIKKMETVLQRPKSDTLQEDDHNHNRSHNQRIKGNLEGLEATTRRKLNEAIIDLQKEVGEIAIVNELRQYNKGSVSHYDAMKAISYYESAGRYQFTLVETPKVVEKPTRTTLVKERPTPTTTPVLRLGKVHYTMAI